MSEPIIRAAGPSDDGAVAALLTDAGLPLPGLAAAAARFVAEVDGTRVGVAALELHEDGGGAASLLRSVAVRPELRGSGLGAAPTRQPPAARGREAASRCPITPPA